MGIGRTVLRVVDLAAGVPFTDLPSSDLTVDRTYVGGRGGNSGDDPVSRLLPVGNQGGFRMAGSPRLGTVQLAVLFSTGRDPDWPDMLDEQTGTFLYYGDNKNPGRELHDTVRGGNLLLRDIYARCYGTSTDRASVPPFLLFTNTGHWRDVRFRGLLAPGGPTGTPDDDLQAVWRVKNGLRFQNYRARFTVLDVPSVSRAWISEILAGHTAGPNCPPAWRSWIEGRAYHSLVARPTTAVRSRTDQMPADPQGAAILATIYHWFSSKPHAFEGCAVELWRMLAPATGRVDLTPPSRDGGRDAIGEYLLGPAPDRVRLEFALEAKCYRPGSAVGVREVSRLISRIRHRMFGVLVTTSHFDKQAYDEVRTDGHPIVLMSGRDIVDALRNHGYTSPEKVLSWLTERFGESS